VTFARGQQLLQDVKALVPPFQERLSEPVPVFPQEELMGLAKCGALAAALPTDAGGLGLGMEPQSSGCLLEVLKQTGRANLAIGRIFEGHVNALLLMQRYGTPQQVEKAARDISERATVFGVWNTGAPGKPVARALSNGRFRLEGGKTFASGAGRIGRAVVTAETAARGWQMFIVPLNEIEYGVDYDSWHPLGMEASDSYSVDLTGVELDGDAALGLPGQYYAEPFFTGGAFRFASVQLGGAEAIFDFCRDYLGERGLADDPHHAYRLGQMAVLIETGRQWVTQAGRWLDAAAEGCDECLAHRARMTRVAAANVCTDVIRFAEQCAGASGLQGRRPLPRMLRDLQMYLRQGAPDRAVTDVGKFVSRDRGTGGGKRA
jgi:alkylation response protein AidB-like acyl-CoA dehydrogenase